MCQNCLLYKSRQCSGFEIKDGVSLDEEPVVEYVPNNKEISYISN